MCNISCRSSNLIYAITCNKCNKQYVGQTSLHLKDRFVQHFRDIEVHNKGKSIGRHFGSSDHSGFKDLQISVLELIRAPPRSPQTSTIRNRVEHHWTHLMRTLAPAGLNMENPKELISKKKLSNPPDFSDHLGSICHFSFSYINHLQTSHQTTPTRHSLPW